MDDDGTTTDQTDETARLYEQAAVAALTAAFQRVHAAHFILHFCDAAALRETWSHVHGSTSRPLGRPLLLARITPATATTAEARDIWLVASAVADDAPAAHLALAASALGAVMARERVVRHGGLLVLERHGRVVVETTETPATTLVLPAVAVDEHTRTATDTPTGGRVDALLAALARLPRWRGYTLTLALYLVSLAALVALRVLVLAAHLLLPARTRHAPSSPRRRHAA